MSGGTDLCGSRKFDKKVHLFPQLPVLTAAKWLVVRLYCLSTQERSKQSA